MPLLFCPKSQQKLFFKSNKLKLCLVCTIVSLFAAKSLERPKKMTLDVRPLKRKLLDKTVCPFFFLLEVQPFLENNFIVQMFLFPKEKKVSEAKMLPEAKNARLQQKKKAEKVKLLQLCIGRKDVTQFLIFCRGGMERKIGSATKILQFGFCKTQTQAWQFVEQSEFVFFFF